MKTIRYSILIDLWFFIQSLSLLFYSFYLKYKIGDMPLFLFLTGVLLFLSVILLKRNNWSLKLISIAFLGIYTTFFTIICCLIILAGSPVPFVAGLLIIISVVNIFIIIHLLIKILCVL